MDKKNIRLIIISITAAFIIGIAIFNITTIQNENIDFSEAYQLTSEQISEGVIVNSQSVELSQEKNNSTESIIIPNLAESENEILEETKFVYFYGEEYDDKNIPKRFGMVVEEDIIKRDNPLKEEAFKILKKGQYLETKYAKNYNSQSIGIVETIGKYDGQIMVTPRQPGTARAETKPYYKIDDDTYVVLFFENNYTYSFPLECIEVWDADGNKLRDIEIE